MASTASSLGKLDFKPGFHRESTQYSEEGSWFDGNRAFQRRKAREYQRL